MKKIIRVPIRLSKSYLPSRTIWKIDEYCYLNEVFAVISDVELEFVGMEVKAPEETKEVEERRKVLYRLCHTARQWEGWQEVETKHLKQAIRVPDYLKRDVRFCKDGVWIYGDREEDGYYRYFYSFQQFVGDREVILDYCAVQIAVQLMGGRCKLCLYPHQYKNRRDFLVIIRNVSEINSILAVFARKIPLRRNDIEFPEISEILRHSEQEGKGSVI